MKDIIALLNSDDKNEIRSAIKSLIINRMESDLEHWDRYILCGEDVENIIDEALKDLIEEVKNEYKNKLREKLFSKFDKVLEQI